MKVWRPVSGLLPGVAAAEYSDRYPVIDQQVGALGELVASAYLDELGIGHTIESQISHDIKLYSGLTIDVKTTTSWYSVSGENTHKIYHKLQEYQTADYFMFINLEIEHGTHKSTDLNRFRGAHIMGVLNAAELFKVARPVHDGARYYTGRREFNVPMLEIKYKQLLPVVAIVG